MANLELENIHSVRLSKKFRQKSRWKIQRRLQEWRAGTFVSRGHHLVGMSIGLLIGG